MTKEDTALELIRTSLSKAKNPVVAFSGGKDSTVVLHLVRKVAPEVPAQFCNTGVENPLTLQFMKTVPNVIELKPKKTFWEIVDKHGLPKPKAGKHKGNICCNWLKEYPARDYNKEHVVDLIFTGITAAESNQRKIFFKWKGPYYLKREGWYKCHPIWDWTEKEVWEYIRANNLPYNKIYDNGAERCGCQPCTAYRVWKRNLARENPKMLRMLLKKYQKQSQLEDAECKDGGA